MVAKAASKFTRGEASLDRPSEISLGCIESFASIILSQFPVSHIPVSCFFFLSMPIMELLDKILSINFLCLPCFLNITLETQVPEVHRTGLRKIINFGLKMISV